jgi:glutamyl-tRNA reductase
MSGAIAPLGIVALVAHARHVPSEDRERFGDAAAAIAADPRVIVIRTCHRVEVYATPDEPAEGLDTPLVLPALPVGGRHLDDHLAIRHLLTVAAGLDSVVVGEDQILHQLRDCLSSRHATAPTTPADVCPVDDVARLAAQRAPLTPVLDRLFQLALHVGRQSRAWREGPPRSLADVALDRIEAACGDLSGQPVLVVGAGRMSRLTALAAARRNARVVVTNRSIERAAALAADVDGVAVAFGSLPGQVAGVVAAVAGPWVLGPAAEAALDASGAHVVDLSSPPAVPAAMRERLGVRFVSVDDIARGPVDAIRDRVRRRIDRLLRDADAELTAWIHGRRAVPAIQALTEQAEARRAAEVDRLLRRLPDLAEHERELVEQMSRRLVAGLLHAPLATLREDQGGEHARAARDLFAL